MSVGTSAAPLALVFILGGLAAIILTLAVYAWGKKTQKLDEKQRIEVLKYTTYSFGCFAFGIWLVWILG